MDASVHAPPLIVISPIVPSRTGNGLAMRVASFVEAASAVHRVQVAVVPVAGSLPNPPVRPPTPVALVPLSLPQARRRHSTELLADPRWRRLLSAAEPMPVAARAASPALADDVVTSSGASPGTPVHAVRSYLAPLAVAVADRLSSPWTTLDLDDDDEQLARSRGETVTADNYHRLLATFAPLFSSRCMASPEEAAAVGARHATTVEVVPNAMTCDGPGPDPRPASGALLLVGNLTYEPNADAAVTLVDQVLPRIAARSDRRVHAVIVGDFAPDGPVANLASRVGVTVTGFVEDLTAYYDTAEIVVAPIATGGGTRIKLIEAFSRGVPVVTTSAGARGLGVRHRTHLLVADDVDAMAAAASELLAAPALGTTLARAAWTYVRTHHSPAVVSAAVLRFLEDARTRRRRSLP